MSNCELGCIDGQIFIPVLKKHVPCPNCTDSGDFFEKPEETQQNILTKLNIPEGFNLEALFDEELLNLNSVRSAFSQDSIFQVKNTLTELNGQALNGVRPKESIYFYTPGVDIMQFAYAYMIKCVESGMRVAPLITVSTLFEIQRTRDFDYATLNEVFIGKKSIDTLSEREKQYYTGYVTMKELGVIYSDFVMSDVLILEATANTSNVAWTAVADIMAERANRGKATMIIGYWSSKQLANTNAKYIIQSSEWATKRLNKFTFAELQNKKYTQQNNYPPKHNESSNQQHYGNGRYRGTSNGTVNAGFDELMSQNKKPYVAPVGAFQQNLGLEDK